jgi:hypothetical protein
VFSVLVDSQKASLCDLDLPSTPWLFMEHWPLYILGNDNHYRSGHYLLCLLYASSLCVMSDTLPHSHQYPAPGFSLVTVNILKLQNNMGFLPCLCYLPYHCCHSRAKRPLSRTFLCEIELRVSLWLWKKSDLPCSCCGYLLYDFPEIVYC